MGIYVLTTSLVMEKYDFHCYISLPHGQWYATVNLTVLHQAWNTNKKTIRILKLGAIIECAISQSALVIVKKVCLNLSYACFVTSPTHQSILCDPQSFVTSYRERNVLKIHLSLWPRWSTHLLKQFWRKHLHCKVWRLI